MTTDTPLPAWIDRDAWEGFVEFRRRQERQSRGRIAWTSRAELLVLKELFRLHAQGHDVNASLDQSVRIGWTDVYAPRQQQDQRQSFRQGDESRAKDRVREMTGGLGTGDVDSMEAWRERLRH